jgi:hypothetical protein
VTRQDTSPFPIEATLNQQNRPQKQMQDQMRAQREQQMKQAAYLDQQAKRQGEPPQASPPPPRRSAGRTALTFVLIVPWLVALCGGIGYAIGQSMLDSETGVIGAALGGLAAFGVAGVITAMVARGRSG